MAKNRSTKGVFDDAIKEIRESAKGVVENMKDEILKELGNTEIDIGSIDINPTVKVDPKFSSNVEKEIKSQIPKEVTVETKVNPKLYTPKNVQGVDLNSLIHMDEKELKKQLKEFWTKAENVSGSIKSQEENSRKFIASYMIANERGINIDPSKLDKLYSEKNGGYTRFVEDMNEYNNIYKTFVNKVNKELSQVDFSSLDQVSEKYSKVEKNAKKANQQIKETAANTKEIESVSEEDTKTDNKINKIQKEIERKQNKLYDLQSQSTDDESSEHERQLQSEIYKLQQKKAAIIKENKKANTDNISEIEKEAEITKEDVASKMELAEANDEAVESTNRYTDALDRNYNVQGKRASAKLLKELYDEVNQYVKETGDTNLNDNIDLWSGYNTAFQNAMEQGVSTKSLNAYYLEDLLIPGFKKQFASMTQKTEELNQEAVKTVESLDKINQVSNDDTPHSGLDSMEKELQEVLDIADEVTNSFNNLEEVVKEYDMGYINATSTTSYNKDEDGNVIPNTTYTVTDGDSTVILNEDLEVLKDINTIITDRNEQERIYKLLKEEENKLIKQQLAQGKAFISQQEKYEKETDLESVRKYKEEYDKLSQKVKEYIELRKETAKSGKLDSQVPEIEQLNNEIIQMADNLEGNPLFNQAFEDKALSGLDKIDAKIQAIRFDKIISNYDKLSTLEAERESLLNKGVSEDDRYIAYLDKQISNISKENNALKSLEYTEEQEIAIQNKSLDVMQKVNKQRALINASGKDLTLNKNIIQSTDEIERMYESLNKMGITTFNEDLKRLNDELNSVGTDDKKYFKLKNEIDILKVSIREAIDEAKALAAAKKEALDADVKDSAFNKKVIIAKNSIEQMSESLSKFGITKFDEELKDLDTQLDKVGNDDRELQKIIDKIDILKINTKNAADEARALANAQKEATSTTIKESTLDKNIAKTKDEIERMSESMSNLGITKFDDIFKSFNEELDKVGTNENKFKILRNSIDKLKISVKAAADETKALAENQKKASALNVDKSSFSKSILQANDDIERMSETMSKFGITKFDDDFKRLSEELNNVGDNKDKLTILKNQIDELKISVKSAADEATAYANSQKDTYNNLIDLINKKAQLKVEQTKLEQNRLVNSQSYINNQADIARIEAEINAVDRLTLSEEQLKSVEEAESEAMKKVQLAFDMKAAAEKRAEEAGKTSQQTIDNTRSALQKQAAALTTNGKLMATYGNEVKALIEEIKNPDTTLERLAQIRIELNKISSEAILAGKSGKSLFQILKQRATSLVAYLSTFVNFYRIISYVRTAFSTIKDLDTQLVDLRKTTTMNTRELNEFYNSASDVAKQLGVTTSEIISQAAAWSRLGYSTKEASTEMAKLSSQFASISPGMDTQSATDSLVSVMQAYKIGVNDVQRTVMDNINAIGNSMATTNEEIGEMLQRSSAAMKAANNSLEETIALEAAAVEITRNAETTGTAFRTISMRIRGYDEETEELSEDLENISGDIYDLTKIGGSGEGISIFTDKTRTEYKSTYDILKEISGIWDELTDKQQADLLEKLGGKRGAQSLAGILEDFSSVDEAMETMENAAGSADREMDIIRDSLEYKINELKQTWTKTLQGMIDRKEIGNIIESLTELSEGISTLIPYISKLKTVVVGLGTVFASNKIGLFAKNWIGNITSSITSLSQVGKSINNIKNATNAINSINSPIVYGGMVDTGAIERYRAALSGLTTEQQALVLSSKGLSVEQAKLVLSYNQAGLAETALSNAEANRVLIEAGLLENLGMINSEELTRLATKTGLTQEEIKSMLIEQGAVETKGKDLVITQELVNATWEEVISKNANNAVGIQAIKSYIADIAAKKAASTATMEYAGATNLLTGAWSKLTAAMAANPLGTAITVITTVLFAGVTIFNKIQKKAEEARKEIEELVSSYEETSDEIKKNKKEFSELSEQYAELSKGVNALGQNVSLSADEFDEYHEVVNKIAELNPDLVKGWDEEGNAILTVKDNVDALTEAYKQQQIQANNSIIARGSDVYGQAQKDINDEGLWESTYYGNKSYTYGTALDEIQKLLNQTEYATSDLEYFKDVAFDAYGEAFDDYTRLINLIQDAGLHVDVYSGDESGLTDYLNNMTDEDRMALKAYLVEQEALYSDAVKSYRDLFDAYLGNQLLTDYQNIDEDIASSFLTNLSNAFDDDFFAKFENQGEIYSFIDNILSQFNNLSNEDENVINMGINLTTQWNNNELTYNEYVKKIEELDALLLDIFGDEDKVAQVKVLFDIPSTTEDAQIQDNAFNNKLTNARREAIANNSSYSDFVDKVTADNIIIANKWYDTLTDSEREFVNNLSSEDFAESVKFTSTEEFDTWLNKLIEENTPIELDVAFSTEMVTNLDKVHDALSGGMDDIYDELLGEDADKTTASIENLQQVIDDAGGITFDFTTEDLKDENFEVNSLSNAIEAYTDAMMDNDNVLAAASGDTTAYQEALNQLATAYIDQSDILDGLTTENYKYYIAVLEANGVTNAEEVVLTRVGEAAQHTSTAITALSTKIAQYKSKLETASESGDWSGISTTEMTEVIDSAKELLDTEGLLGDELDRQDWNSYIQDNFEELEKAAEGDTEAIDELRLALVKLAYAQKYSTLNTEEGLTQYTKLQTAIDNLTTEELEGLANGTLSLEDTGIWTALQDLWATMNDGTEQAKQDFEDIVNILSGGSIDINVETYGNGQYTDMSGTWKGSSTGAEVNQGNVDDDDDSDSDDDDDDDITYSEESWDWIETAISRLESQIDRLDQEVENVYDNWSKRNGALAEEIDAITQEIEMQSDAADRYFEESEEIYIPDEYKTKVQNGEMDVETINESNITDSIISYFNDLLAQGIGDAEDIEAYNNGELQNGDYVDMLSDAISDYTDLYEKAMDASDQVVSLSIEKQGLFQDYFDNIKDEYEDFIDVIGKKVDWIEERIDRTEEHGYFVDESYYQELLANEKDQYATLMAQRDELIEAMNTAVSTGGIEKGSSAWNEMYEDILDVNQAIEESLTNTVKLNNEIRQLKWDKFDYLEERLSDINDEAEFFIKLLSGEDMYDDYGMFNERGWANAAMVASKYNDTLMKAQRYEEELLEIEQDLAEDPYNKDLIERKEELTQAYRNAIEAAEDEKQAMKSLVEEGINRNLQALQDLIDEYSEAMQAAKDLYDWQKSVSDQTENIANLQKQLTAYEGDDSEEARKRRQELSNQLEDAEQALEESQWDHYISETNDMLSELYDNYEETLNARLDNIDLLMQDMIDEINDAKTQVAGGLSEVSDMYGYSSTNFQNYLSGDFGGDLVSKFEDGEFASNMDTAASSLTAIETSVSGITEKILTAQDTYYNGVIDAIKEGNDFTLQVNDDGTITKVSNSSSSSDSSAPTTSGSSGSSSNVGTSVSGGTWKQNDTGWWYEYADGSYESNGFRNIDGKDYYFDENGYMKADEFVQGKWLDHSGEASGEYQWTKDGDNWQYENNDGSKIKGNWAIIDGEWYYFDEDGHMVTGTAKIGGKSYSFGSDGKWLGYAKGSKKIPYDQMAWTQEQGSELIYRSSDGAILTPLGKDDMVFTHDMSQRLWSMASGEMPTGIAMTSRPNVSGTPQNVSLDNEINIVLPNVENYEDFKIALKNDAEMERFWQEITIGQAMGNNSLKKFAI